MILVLGKDMHPLEFCQREDLYLFQQALTGYKVVDNYMEYVLINSIRRYNSNFPQIPFTSSLCYGIGPVSLGCLIAAVASHAARGREYNDRLRAWPRSI
jgi:hypothetical protein